MYDHGPNTSQEQQINHIWRHEVHQILHFICRTSQTVYKTYDCALLLLCMAGQMLDIKTTKCTQNSLWIEISNRTVMFSIHTFLSCGHPLPFLPSSIYIIVCDIQYSPWLSSCYHSPAILSVTQYCFRNSYWLSLTCQFWRIFVQEKCVLLC